MPETPSDDDQSIPVGSDWLNPANIEATTDLETGLPLEQLAAEEEAELQRVMEWGHFTREEALRFIDEQEQLDHANRNLNTPETQIPTIDQLPARLGYVETPELTEVRFTMTEAMRNGSSQEVQAAFARYYALSEETILQQQFGGIEFGRAQIGLSLQIALAKCDAGRTETYLDDLRDLLLQADNFRFEDLTPLLRQAVDEARRQIEGS